MDRFEGPEKKLEIILSDPQTGLRDNSDGRWDRVVRASGAEILKRKYGDDLDSYLLSESSLFVWDDRILIITCGRTTPVKALPMMLEFIAADNVAYLFYERKNLNFPDDQPSAFEDDQARLLNYFPGKSIMMGSAARDHIHIFYYANPAVTSLSDACLQILMHDIDPSVARTFFRENSPAELQAATLARLTEIYPLMNIDSHFFYPQGYSLNGISSKNYYTVHVTPQSEASYVSFESNIIDHDSPKVVEKVVSVFNPRRYSLVFKTTNDGSYADFHRTLVANQPGYQTMDQMRHKFDGHYTASFSNFLKQRH